MFRIVFVLFNIMTNYNGSRTAEGGAMKKKAVTLLMISMMGAVSLTACGSKEEAATTETLA